MVVSERLIWLHIPKTAGDATLQMFQQLSHPWRILDPHTDPQKHGTLADAYDARRARSPAPSLINLRRLPEVLVSYFHHMQRHGAGAAVRQADVPSANCASRSTSTTSSSTPKPRPTTGSSTSTWAEREADHYLRVSDLAESFLEVVGRHHEIDPEMRDRVRSIRANVGSYERRGRDWLVPPRRDGAALPQLSPMEAMRRGRLR